MKEFKAISAFTIALALALALVGCGDTLLSARMAYFTGVVDTLKDGISFLNADAIDRFAGSDMMIFSKTGTITEGKYSVVAVYPVDYEEKDLLTIAALAECQSKHPIAVALREACGIDIHHRSDITLLEETPGRGIHTLFGGRNVYVGNSSLLLDHNIVFDVPSHKGTVIHVAVDNKYAGCIVLNDRVRDAAFDAIEELRLRGIRAAVMLTGDVRSMARPIASSLSFDMVKCELSNESKLEALNYLRESKGNSAAISYVSSKDEDLELLQAADIGIGFNALTEYKLIGAASVLLMGNKIFQIPQALFRAKRITVAALLSAIIMLGLELLLLVLGLLGGVSVWVAMLLILLGRIGTLAYSIYFR
jgi:Cd2+/Zn2+-exporting ATPase